MSCLVCHCGDNIQRAIIADPQGGRTIELVPGVTFEELFSCYEDDSWPGVIDTSIFLTHGSDHEHIASLVFFSRPVRVVPACHGEDEFVDFLKSISTYIRDIPAPITAVCGWLTGDLDNGCGCGCGRVDGSERRLGGDDNAFEGVDYIYRLSYDENGLHIVKLPTPEGEYPFST